MASFRVAAIRTSSLLRTPITTRQTSSLVKPVVAQKPSAPIFLSRSYASEAASSGVEAPDYLDERERKIFDTIKGELHPTKLEVQDISGGCGSMYALDIVSEQFKGLPVIKQHRLVNKVLGEEVKKWHGLQLKTKAP
ncbi:hypothetical protein KC340_g4614 [Hortaea werneckii]|nr:hypothetical protein KC342_g6200 [Hortaea werneckii]KAI7101451.1 hypothetical protein KC339_g6732 [Hortaea werneckii]KAI7243180.1 hypothetical protein KC365_g2511 [Hortaea werneckii]KAI7329533.1 hypothetical protein KC340_g4614 [Hortaea werneckii]KAI7375133.1 hypothetical protein KC328_g15616 [Hortaea werneckii]